MWYHSFIKNYGSAHRIGTIFALTKATAPDKAPPSGQVPDTWTADKAVNRKRLNHDIGTFGLWIICYLRMCRTTQFRLTKQEIQHVVTEFDLDGNGLIDFGEFLNLIKTVVRRAHPSLEEVIKILRLKSAARKPFDVVRIARCHTHWPQPCETWPSCFM